MSVEIEKTVLIVVSMERALLVLGDLAVIVIVAVVGGVKVEIEVTMEVVVDGCAELVVTVTVDSSGGVYVETEVMTEVVVDGCAELVVTVTVEAVGGVYVDTAVVVSMVVVVEARAELVVRVVVVMLIEELEAGMTVTVDVNGMADMGVAGCESCSDGQQYSIPSNKCVPLSLLSTR